MIGFVTLCTALLSIAEAARDHRETVFNQRKSGFGSGQYHTGSWHVAPTISEQGGQRRQYLTHNQTSLPALGLPEGCISYKDRYSRYHTTPHDMAKANLKHPESELAILMRIHRGLEWTDDLILSTRALISEASNLGWHVWLLAQETVDVQPISNALPTNSMGATPEEFGPLQYTFTAEQIHLQYPEVHKYRPEGAMNEYTSTRRECYLGPTAFMKRYPGYAFAFVMEYDIRFIGDWGQFYSGVLSLASRAVAGQSPSPYENKVALHDRKGKGRSLPLPDLILFGNEIPEPDEEATSVREGDNLKYPPQEVIMGQLALFGISKKMANIIHKNSKWGNGGFIEDFLPTLAAHEDVNVAIVPLGEWNDEKVLHCCSEIVPQIYNEFFQTDECHAFTIIHPVKNSNKTLWTNAQNLGRL